MTKPNSRVIALSLLGIWLVGCTTSSIVRTSELPRLNGAYSYSHSTAYRTDITQTVIHVQRPDGSTLELEGEYDVAIESRVSGIHRFEHPFIVRSDGEGFVVAGGDQPEQRFSANDISEVRMVQVDGPASVWLLTGIVLTRVFGRFALVVLLSD